MAHERKWGSLGAEMRQNIRGHYSKSQNKASRNANRACEKFDDWRKSAGISNAAVRSDRRAAVQQWHAALQQQGYSPATIHTYVAGACTGLGISMAGLCKQGTSADKVKSIGACERSHAARSAPGNAEVVRFQQAVGGRRAALERLTGADYRPDESGHMCVVFERDKGGKTQYQRVSPENQALVAGYFAGKGTNERIFGKIDRNLDLHGMRAEHARAEYSRYERICSTPAGRARIREELWARFRAPGYGNKSYLEAAARGNKAGMDAAEAKFRSEMADGRYDLRGPNREMAIADGRPTSYDRLALCATSVFALSHWRNEVTVKHYMV